MTNLTSMTPSFYAIAEYANELTNQTFFAMAVVVIGILFVIRYQDYPPEWYAPVTLFVTSILSVILSIAYLVPQPFVLVNIGLFALSLFFAALSKQR